MHAPSHPPAEPASPCTGVCRLNATTRQCEGCLRTLDEIAAWPTLASGEKRQLLAALATRARHP